MIYTRPVSLRDNVPLCAPPGEQIHRWSAPHRSGRSSARWSNPSRERPRPWRPPRCDGCHHQHHHRRPWPRIQRLETELSVFVWRKWERQYHGERRTNDICKVWITENEQYKCTMVVYCLAAQNRIVQMCFHPKMQTLLSHFGKAMCNCCCQDDIQYSSTGLVLASNPFREPLNNTAAKTMK
jgi:hypothetical protein